jgi:hypothetical protein
VSEKSQGNKGETIFQGKKEKKKSCNHKRGIRIAEKHEKQKVYTKKSRKQSTVPSLAPWWQDGAEATIATGKFGDNRLADLVSG